LARIKEVFRRDALQAVEAGVRFDVGSGEVVPDGGVVGDGVHGLGKERSDGLPATDLTVGQGVR
jgi:hypothetical protein